MERKEIKAVSEFLFLEECWRIDVNWQCVACFPTLSSRGNTTPELRCSVGSGPELDLFILLVAGMDFVKLNASGGLAGDTAPFTSRNSLLAIPASGPLLWLFLPLDHHGPPTPSFIACPPHSFEPMMQHSLASCLSQPLHLKQPSNPCLHLPSLFCFFTALVRCDI